MELDLRWKQRLDNYQKALNELREAIELSLARELTKLEKQGLIQGFEYTHELAWNCIKDYLEYQSPLDIKGSRDATREAFKVGIIKNGEVWMQMIRSRNLTSYTYNKKTADELALTIINDYYPEFVLCEAELKRLSALREF